MYSVHLVTRIGRYCSIWIAAAVFCLSAIPAGAQSNVLVRVMCANLTSGTGQRYETPGLDIFKGLKPDVHRAGLSLRVGLFWRSFPLLPGF